MDIYKLLETNARKNLKTILFPETNDRVIAAVKEILRRKIARVVMIDESDFLSSCLRNDSNLLLIDSKFSHDFVKDYISVRSKKNNFISPEKAIEELKSPMTFSCMLLKKNFADAVIAGSSFPTSEVLRNAISIIGPSKNNKTVSSFFLFTFQKGHAHEKKMFVYADCGIIPDPDAERLSDIAIQTAKNFRKLTGIKPKVAFLSYSTKGSAAGLSIEKVNEAIRITKKRNRELLCDGELQFDAAFVPDVAKRKNPNGVIKGDANVFIFPDLNSGNIAYKITERIGGASATGPIVQGLAKPVMDLSRGCSSDDIVNMTLVACNLI